MNMSKHTPGPWTVNTQKNECRTIWVGGNANAGGFQQEVADVYTHHDRAQANATLIAAAPDMLAQLKYVTAVLQALEGKVKTTTLVTECNAVIAKAEGES